MEPSPVAKPTHWSSGATATKGETCEPDYAYCLRGIQEFPHCPTSLGQEMVERFLALIALILFAPLMLVIAAIIRFDSPGPALFRQLRVQQGGKLFRFTKFRTYYADAKDRFPELYIYTIAPETLQDYKFKVPDDPRATRFGKWLRKSTLDELPNLWHVLTGEMTIVGPRPEIPEFLPNYTHEELRIFCIRPGVTGLAQISGRGLLTFPETCAYNLEYLKKRSVAFDTKIVVLTVWRVILRHGAF